MTIKTIYVCDVCGEHYGDLNRMRQVLIMSPREPGKYSNRESLNSIDYDVCVPCLKRHFNIEDIHFEIVDKRLV